MRRSIIFISSVLLLLYLFGAFNSESVQAEAASATGTHGKQTANELLRFDPRVDGSFLLDAIKNHPKAEVSQVLWSKIDSREIAIRGLDRPEASARFVPMPAFDREHRMVGLMGALYISPQAIVPARAGRPLERQYLDVVLLHESVHYEQIASGRFASTVITDSGDSPEQCEAGWNLEREAYERECAFAREIGFDRLPYCTTDLEAFDRALFAALSPSRPDACPVHWRRMLGI